MATKKKIDYVKNGEQNLILFQYHFSILPLSSSADRFSGISDDVTMNSFSPFFIIIIFLLPFVIQR